MSKLIFADHDHALQNEKIIQKYISLSLTKPYFVIVVRKTYHVITGLTIKAKPLPKYKKSLEGYYYTVYVKSKIYLPQILLNQYDYHHYRLIRIRPFTLCHSTSLPHKKLKCPKKNIRKVYELKICHKKNRRACSIVYLKRVPYNYLSLTWVITKKIDRRCKAGSHHTCDCHYEFTVCHAKKCIPAYSKSYPTSTCGSRTEYPAAGMPNSKFLVGYSRKYASNTQRRNTQPRNTQHWNVI